MKKYLVAATVVLLVLAVHAVPGIAHHGWKWTTGGNIELVGVIEEVSLGMPHGIITVNADGEVWTVEVGQPWRNERAGLKDGDLAAGVEIRAVGEPAADPADKRLKAERLYIAGREYNLYPERT
jgi:HAMP domain-containing protein